LKSPRPVSNASRFCSIRENLSALRCIVTKRADLSVYLAAIAAARRNAASSPRPTSAGALQRRHGVRSGAHPQTCPWKQSALMVCRRLSRAKSPASLMG
jgi:hypothetical protein